LISIILNGPSEGGREFEESLALSRMLGDTRSSVWILDADSGKMELVQGSQERAVSWVFGQSIGSFEDPLSQENLGPDGGHEDILKPVVWAFNLLART